MASTTETLRALAARFEQEGLDALNALDEGRSRLAYRRAAWCRRLADEIEREDLDVLRLPEVDQLSTLSTMQPTQVRTRGSSVSAAMLDREKGPPPYAWTVLHAHNLSLPQWVALENAEHPEDTVKPNTAGAWLKRGREAGGRPIPERWAAYAAKRFHAPALLRDKSWPNGIRREKETG